MNEANEPFIKVVLETPLYSSYKYYNTSPDNIVTIRKSHIDIAAKFVEEYNKDIYFKIIFNFKNSKKKFYKLSYFDFNKLLENNNATKFGGEKYHVKTEFCERIL